MNIPKFPKNLCVQIIKIITQATSLKTTEQKTIEQQNHSISDIHFLPTSTVPRRLPKKRTQPILLLVLTPAFTVRLPVIIIKTVPVAPDALPALVRNRVAFPDALPEDGRDGVRVQPEHLQDPPGVLQDELQHQVPGLRLGLLVEVGQWEGVRRRRVLPAEHLRRVGRAPGEVVGAGDLGYVRVGMGRVLARAAGGGWRCHLLQGLNCVSNLGFMNTN